MFYSRGYGPTGYFLMSSYKVFFLETFSNFVESYWHFREKLKNIPQGIFNFKHLFP